jgi:hypothetical protein
VEDVTEPSVSGGRLHDLLTRVVDETGEVCRDLGRELLGEPVPAAGAAPVPQ